MINDCLSDEYCGEKGLWILCINEKGYVTCSNFNFWDGTKRILFKKHYLIIDNVVGIGNNNIQTSNIKCCRLTIKMA